MFGGLSDAIKSLLASHLTKLTIPNRALLMMQGDEADTMFFIIKGTANIFVSGDFRGYVADGDIVGQASLLTDRNYRSATVRTTSAMELLVLKRQDFNIVVKWHPEFKVQTVKPIS